MLFSLVLLVIYVCLTLGTGYLYLLMVGSFLPIRRKAYSTSKLKFAVVIPAHDEASVIANTVRTILNADIESELLQVFVVADHCTDATAQLARDAGATVFDRSNGERGGKGAALSWLFSKILNVSHNFDAVVIFDADTAVDGGFFRAMNQRLAEGEAAIQGRHIIRNHGAGWLPALTWAMFIIDNRFQNLGRAALGFSAKNMGDSICFRADVLQRFGWGTGLTEDYSFRQRLLLEGIRIAYEPRAIGYGDAAANWRVARAQHSRWMRGVQRANRGAAGRLLRQALAQRSLPMLEGALQAAMPSYSTLTLLAVALTALAWLVTLPAFPWLRWVYGGVAVALFLFPLLNLALERAPAKAFWVILSGPVYIVWRTVVKLYALLVERGDVWVRTPRVVINNEQSVKNDNK